MAGGYATIGMDLISGLTTHATVGQLMLSMIRCSGVGSGGLIMAELFYV